VTLLAPFRADAIATNIEVATPDGGAYGEQLIIVDAETDQVVAQAPPQQKEEEEDDDDDRGGFWLFDLDDGRYYARTPSGERSQEFEVAGPGPVHVNLTLSSTMAGGATTEPARPAAPPEPKYNFGLGGNYLYQRLPGNSGELGVVGVGGAEQELLRNPRELDGWTIDAWNTIWHVGPKIAGSAATVYLGGSYGQADGERDNAVGSDPGINNGITWWGRDATGSSGIASTGSNVAGNVELDFTTFEIRGGLKWDFPCGDEEYDDEEGPWPYPRLRLVLDPTTIVETGIGIHYNEQDVRQQFFLGNPAPGFSRFDVRTRNKVESTDWSFLYNLGVQQVLPIPGLRGTLLTVGADAGVGYYRQRADADQWNSCDIEFAALPGVNQCNPASNFGVSVDPDHSGFDYRVGASVRLSQSLDFIHPGVHVGASYQFDYAGVSQLDTPVNFDVDGPPDVDWSHQPRHEFGLFAGMFF
jgi:hypothetical protein